MNGFMCGGNRNGHTLPPDHLTTDHLFFIPSIQTLDKLINQIIINFSFAYQINMGGQWSGGQVIHNLFNSFRIFIKV